MKEREGMNCVKMKSSILDRLPKPESGIAKNVNQTITQVGLIVFIFFFF
jgi:hypothetical protein